MSRASSHSLAANLEILRTLLWVFFWIVTALAAVLWPLGIGEAQLAEHVGNGDLRAALNACLQWLDLAWITLAAVNVYLAVAAQEGLATARRWMLTCFIGASVVIALGAKTGWPFGPITYTTQLGPRLLGLIPAALPLLWFVIVASSRITLRRFFPHAANWQLALGCGLLALVSGICVELVAWKIRAYWLWYALQTTVPNHAPWQNYAAWLVLGAVLGGALREKAIVPARGSMRPLAVLIAINGVFALTWLVWNLYQ